MQITLLGPPPPRPEYSSWPGRYQRLVKELGEHAHANVTLIEGELSKAPNDGYLLFAGSLANCTTEMIDRLAPRTVLLDVSWQKALELLEAYRFAGALDSLRFSEWLARPESSTGPFGLRTVQKSIGVNFVDLPPFQSAHYCLLESNRHQGLPHLLADYLLADQLEQNYRVLDKESDDLAPGETETNRKSRLDAAGKTDEALSLTLCLLNSTVPEEIRRDAAKELNLMIAPPSPQAGRGWVRYDHIGEGLRGVLFSHPLPVEADITPALQVTTDPPFGWGRGLLQHVSENQSSIRLIRKAWDELPLELFGSTKERARFLAVSVREGLFETLTFTSVRESLDDFITKSLLIPLVRALKNAETILRRWVEPLRLDSTPLTRSPRTVPDRFEVPKTQPQPEE